MLKKLATATLLSFQHLAYNSAVVLVEFIQQKEMISSPLTLQQSTKCL